MRNFTKSETYIIEDLADCMWCMKSNPSLTAREVHGELFSESVVVIRHASGEASRSIDIRHLHRVCDSLGYSMEELMFEAYVKYKNKVKVSNRAEKEELTNRIK